MSGSAAFLRWTSCPAGAYFCRKFGHYHRTLSNVRRLFPGLVIYLDIAKAFDKVDHAILLDKLGKLGVGGKLHDWLKLFLTNRVQRVRVNGALSKPQTVKSGVPQGSVLGPILFLIVMLDIDARISHSMIGSFADDTRIWKAVRSEQEQMELQNDLDILYQWAEENNFFFNEKKFEHLSYGRHVETFEYETPLHKLIGGKDNVRDLGVYFSHTGSFEDHIAH